MGIEKIDGRKNALKKGEGSFSDALTKQKLNKNSQAETVIEDAQTSAPLAKPQIETPVLNVAPAVDAKPIIKKDSKSSTEGKLRNLAQTHFSSDSLNSSLATMYKIYAQAAADGVPQATEKYAAGYNAARTNFKKQLAAFVSAAQKYGENEGDLADVYVKGIIKEKIKQTRESVVAELKSSVSKNLEYGTSQYENANPRLDDPLFGIDRKDVTLGRFLFKPIVDAQPVSFDIFTKEGHNQLAGRALKSVYAKDEGGSGLFGWVWNNVGLRHLWQAATYDETIVKQAEDISTQAAKYADDDINMDIDEAIRETPFALQSEPPPPTPTPTPYRSSESYGYGGGCFVAGTKVTLKDGRTKNIEDIVIGDEVAAFDEQNGVPYTSLVTEVMHHEAQSQILHHFALQDGTMFTSNQNHPIYVKSLDHYFRAEDVERLFNEGNLITLQNAKGEAVELANIDLETSFVPVYNLHVNGLNEKHPRWHEAGVGHNYYANGVLVHNWMLK